MRVENDRVAAEIGQAATEPGLASDQPRRDDRDRICPPPHRDGSGRDAIRAGIRAAEAKGLSGSALLAALLSETLPRLFNAYGPANAALILTRIARDLRTGSAPNTTRQ
jgi:hypothetical protein